MGLFSFIKGAGKGGDADETALAAQATRQITAAGMASNVAVTIKDGAATITGQADSLKSKELAILFLGNTKGVETVNADGLQVVAAAQPTAPAAGTGAAAASAPGAAPFSSTVMYTVQSGDTLSKIAKQHLGDASKFPQIFEANRPMLKDPDEIFPGQVLRIPKAA